MDFLVQKSYLLSQYICGYRKRMGILILLVRVKVTVSRTKKR